MIRMLTATALVGALCLTAVAEEPKPLLAAKGKLLFSDDFNGPLSKEWRVGKGKWEVVDGAVKATEVKDDMHAAVIRHAMPFRNVVIEYSFRLDGAKATTFSINDAKHHLCRAVINARGVTVRKDDSDKDGPDKAVVLQALAMPIPEKEWHTLRIEIVGKDMLACLDGKHIAFGAHDSIDAEKANFGLTVAGDSVSFKGLRVWEATPAKDWEATKAKLIESRGKP
jgi:hypothetical protein